MSNTFFQTATDELTNFLEGDRLQQKLAVAILAEGVASIRTNRRIIRSAIKHIGKGAKHE